jgi:hypothetical protein
MTKEQRRAVGLDLGQGAQRHLATGWGLASVRASRPRPRPLPSAARRARRYSRASLTQIKAIDRLAVVRATGPRTTRPGQGTQPRGHQPWAMGIRTILSSAPVPDGRQSSFGPRSWCWRSVLACCCGPTLVHTRSRLPTARQKRQPLFPGADPGCSANSTSGDASAASARGRPGLLGVLRDCGVRAKLSDGRSRC